MLGVLLFSQVTTWVKNLIRWRFCQVHLIPLKILWKPLASLLKLRHLKVRIVTHNFPRLYFYLKMPNSALGNSQFHGLMMVIPKQCRLIPDNSYVLPSGYKVEMKVVENDGPWKLVGTVGEGFLCHKPCTVSGGGKSEISKPLTDAIVCGPVFIADWKEDMRLAREVIDKDYSDRFLDSEKGKIEIVRFWIPSVLWVQLSNCLLLPNLSTQKILINGWRLYRKGLRIWFSLLKEDTERNGTMIGRSISAWILSMDSLLMS